MTGTIEAKGGSGGSVNRTSNNATESAAGGGGSGGGIVLAATQINLSGTVDATGGAGGTLTGSTTTKFYGGGGGGGRIALYYQTLSGNTPTLNTNIFVSGGLATTGVSNSGTAGASGSFHNAGPGSFPFQPVSTPELSSFCLALFGALPVLLRRRTH